MQSQNNHGASFSAGNKRVAVYGTETIVLNDLSISGFSNLSLTITNQVNSADQVSLVKIYASNDGFNWFVLDSDVFASTPIAVNSTVNQQFTAVAIYLRVTVTSTTNSLIDCYVVGLPNGIIASDLPAGSVPSNRQIIAGTGLSGGGDLTADRTLELDSTEVVLLSLLGQQTGSINVTSSVEGDGGFVGPSLTALSGGNVSILAPSHTVNIGTGTETAIGIGNGASTTTFIGSVVFPSNSITASEVSGVVKLSPGSQQTGFINVSGNIEGDGGFTSTSASATNITTTVNSAALTLGGAYWNGAASVANTAAITNVVDSTSPRSHLNINVGSQNFLLYSDGKMSFQDGVSATVGAASTGAIRYNNTTKNFEVSDDTAGYDGLVQLTKTQTLTNKTISGSSNTITNIGNSSLTNSTFTATAGTGLTGTATVSLGGSFTFAVDSTVVILSSAQTLTNKTISGSTNTITNIANASLANSSFTATAGTGLTGTATTSLGGTFTFAIDSTVVTLTGTQTLTNKTLTAPAISSPTLSGSATFSGGVVANGGLQLHRISVANTDYNTLSTDIIVAYTSLSAARVVTGTVVGTASSPAILIIKDESGGASPINTITFTPASGNIDDTFSKVLINSAYGFVRIYCNGTNFFTF